MAIEIYKKNQGKYTRLGTLLGGVLIGGIGAIQLGQWIAAGMSSGGMSIYVRYGIPAAIILALGATMAWLVNRPGPADFLIATEGEMKKVSWSSKKEVVGSTKVVIITAIIISMLLLGVDLMFIWVFRNLGVMG